MSFPIFLTSLQSIQIFHVYLILLNNNGRPTLQKDYNVQVIFEIQSLCVLDESITPQFSKRVISFFVLTSENTGISKPQLRHGKLGFVCDQTAVLPPIPIVRIAVAAEVYVCACVVQSACTFEWNRVGSTPVGHIFSVTWHPPATHFPIVKECWMIAAVLNKLLTMRRWSCQDC